MPSSTTEAQRIAQRYRLPSTGRPSDIGDPVLVQKLLDAVSDGNYLETACKLAGFSKQTVYQWLKRAEQGQEPFTLFRDALENAEARAEALAVSRVRRAGEDPRFWAAEMTWLERRYPDRYGRRQEDNSAPRVIVQIGVQGSDVQVQLHETLSPVPRKELPAESTG